MYNSLHIGAFASAFSTHDTILSHAGLSSMRTDIIEANPNVGVIGKHHRCQRLSYSRIHSFHDPTLLHDLLRVVPRAFGDGSMFL